ncbi:multidrug efflux pump subunit AcrB [Bradyrhizobium sp. F1.13.4]
MKRFNLSAWAVSHPTLILFLMLILGVAGFFSYQKLGRAEDPFFTVKVVNVSVLWPGATAQEMQAQVADPIEGRRSRSCLTSRRSRLIPSRASPRSR